MIRGFIQSKAAQTRFGGAFYHIWMSPWTLWMGFRYLKSKKSSQFLSFITLLSIFGVGLGVAAMIVVLSVMDGFESELKKRLMTSELHVLIKPTSKVPGFDLGFVPIDSFVNPEIENDERISGFWPVLASEGILRTGRKVTGVVAKGVGKEQLAKLRTYVVESAESQLLIKHEGSKIYRSPGIYVGQELAFEMGIIPGDFVTLISPTETEGPMGGVPRLKKYVVEGVYRSGLPEQELHTVFMKKKAMESFLRRKNVLSHWEISVKDFDTAPALASEIREQAPHFLVRDWIQLNANLFASLKLERISMFVILAFIVIVASFNIVTTLSMMVLEKKKEIAILKAMGARRGQVAAIFMSEGLLIGTLGIGGGVGLAWLICTVLKRYDFIELPDIYYDRTLPVSFESVVYLGVGLAALAIILAACLYPSNRAAKLHPLEGIRNG